MKGVRVVALVGWLGSCAGVLGGVGFCQIVTAGGQVGRLRLTSSSSPSPTLDRAALSRVMSTLMNASATNATACACYSFCTLHDAQHSLKLVPITLGPDSPWLVYLRGVYGDSFSPPAAGEKVVELERLQLLYTRGLPVARCAPAHGTHVAPATIPQLPRRVDPICAPSECAAWYPPGGTPVERPPMRGIEPYFMRATLDVVAVRWWWRAPPVFASSNAWFEVFRWRRPLEGQRQCNACVAPHTLSSVRCLTCTHTRAPWRTDGFWYVHAAGSGIWLNAGPTVADAAKHNLSYSLAARYTSRFGGPLPPTNLVAREPTRLGSWPLAFTARGLGYDTVQVGVMHLPSGLPRTLSRRLTISDTSLARVCCRRSTLPPSRPRSSRATRRPWGKRQQPRKRAMYRSISRLVVATWAVFDASPHRRRPMRTTMHVVPPSCALVSMPAPRADASARRPFSTARRSLGAETRRRRLRDPSSRRRRLKTQQVKQDGGA